LQSNSSLVGGNAKEESFDLSRKVSSAGAGYERATVRLKPEREQRDVDLSISRRMRNRRSRARLVIAQPAVEKFAELLWLTGEVAAIA
jgi:hypothetical protein